MKKASYLLLYLTCFQVLTVAQEKFDDNEAVKTAFLFGLKKHQNIVEHLKNLNSQSDYAINYGKQNPLLTELVEGPGPHRIVFVDHMSYVDRDSLFDLTLNDRFRWMYFLALTNTLDEYAFVDNPSEIDSATLETARRLYHDQSQYVYILELGGNRSNVSQVAPVLDQKEVDQLPVPVGGLENFLRAVTLNVPGREEIDFSSFPTYSEFEVEVGGGYRMNSVAVLTKFDSVLDPDGQQTKFLEAIARNIEDYSHNQYPWEPGIKDGKKVVVKMKLRIPRGYF